MVSNEYVEQRLQRMRVWMHLRGLAPVTVSAHARCESGAATVDRKPGLEVADIFGTSRPSSASTRSRRGTAASPGI